MSRDLEVEEGQQLILQIYNWLHGENYENFTNGMMCDIALECQYMDMDHDPEDEHKFEFIEQEGGGEGGAEYCTSVFKWDGIAYKMSYRYRSFDGYDFDYCRIKEVEPVVREVTFYE